MNPVRRDVVSIGGAGDNVTIRFETNNVGPWIMHWFVSLFQSQVISITNRLNELFVWLDNSVISTGT